MLRKYIPFDGLAELEGTLEALKAIKQHNSEAMKEFLEKTGIAYTAHPDGVSISLSGLDPRKLEAYVNFFNEMKEITVESYKKLGVVFVECKDTGREELMLDIIERKN